MLKFLLIVAVSLYILTKIGSFFFRAGVASKQFKPNRGPASKDNEARPSGKDKKPFKGGDYVDYEEVK